MEQLVFDLAAADPPSFQNFVAGGNAEVLAAVSRFAAGEGNEVALLVWGAPGAGKSHLLQAAVSLVRERGGEATLLARPACLETADIDALATQQLIAVDRVDDASTEEQAQLFTLYNALKSNGGRLLAASSVPLAALPLRQDVRTRLGWGLVYAVTPLDDTEKPSALLAYAQQRGFALSEEVIRYLLAHGRRDMKSLLATLSALDRHSLATKRAITVPLLRDWLQREMPLGG
jgi:DnaA family protein